MAKKEKNKDGFMGFKDKELLEQIDKHLVVMGTKYSDRSHFLRVAASALILSDNTKLPAGFTTVGGD